MKKFILRLAVLIVPLLILELGITISQDPGQIESKRYLEMKDFIINQQNAKLNAVPAEWGDFQKAYIEERKKRKLPPFQVVTWGSSRSSEITADFFPNNTYYNCVIPGGSVLDDVALYALYKKYNYLPQSVILNIDPWTFYKRTIEMTHGRNYFIHDRNHALTARKGLEEYFGEGMKAIGKPLRIATTEESSEDIVARYIELLSPSYFQASLKELSFTPISRTTETFIPGYFVLRKDGSYTLNKPGPEKLESIETNALNYAKLARGDFYCDGCAEGENMDILLALIDQLKKDHINIILFISPVHPTLYDALKEHEKNRLEQRINEIAKERHLVLVGSFDPYRYNLQAKKAPTDFIDECHITEQAMRTIFRKHQQEINGALLP